MFIPLHYYFIKAMDAMYANLTSNVPLPPAQVVRTMPRGGTPGSAPADHHGQRAADRRNAERRQRDHVLGQHAEIPD